MIPMSDMKWFIDPIQSPHLKSDRVYVFLDRYPRPGRSNVGKIVKVKGFEHTGKHVWWVTEDGNYVYGAPVSPQNLTHYRPMVAMLSDTVFGVGESYLYNEAFNHFQMRNVRRSDLKQVDAPGGSTFVHLNVKEYFAGAPWARLSMPLLTDTDDMVRLKVEIAKAKWERRWAEAEIVREATARGWDDDINSLHDDGHMEKPIWGAMVEGSALIPVTGTMEPSDADKLRLEQLVSRNVITGSAVARPMMAVPVKFAVNIGTPDTTIARDPGREALSNGLRAQFGLSNLTLGEVATTPVLTGTI